MSDGRSLLPLPEIDSIWGGGGVTIRVLEQIDDGYSCLRLTGRGRLLKRPRDRVFVPTHNFTEGRLRPTTLPDSWKPGNS